MVEIFPVGAAIGLSIAGYLFYWLGIRRQLVRPNRASWLIWSAVTTVEALTYQAVNEGLAQNIIFFVSAASCLLITIAVWRQSSWQQPSASERMCMAVALASLIVWIGFKESLWAHLLVVAAVPVSFWPTWQSALEDRRREDSPAWGLWALGDLATLFVIVSGSERHAMDLPYIVIELGCHASVWAMIGLGTIDPRRLLGLRGTGALDDRPAVSAGGLRIGENALGKAVFAARRFALGALLVEFTGPRWHRSEVFSNGSGPADRFFQIDQQHYMGASGAIDDLINHSCNPNAGLRFADGAIYLVAIRPIARGEEICWDYSTTASQSAFWMRCACGAEQCRGVIGDFEFLEEPLKQRYRALELVPPYLREPVEPGLRHADIGAM